jgi:hypothetical protein
VHNRGRGALGFLSRSRQSRSAAPAPPIDSDSSSMTSATGSPSRHSISHSVLAEVHHSTEVLRQRIEEERPQSQNENNPTSQSQFFVPHPNFSDNSVYIPDAEGVEDAVNSNLANPNWSQAIIHQQDAFSSLGRVVDNSSDVSSSTTNNNQDPIV